MRILRHPLRAGDAELSVRADTKKSEAVTIADRLVAGTAGYRPRFV